MQVLDPNDASSFLTNVTGVAAGHVHTVAVKGDGTVWAWGNNITTGSITVNGILGVGTDIDSSSIPVQVLDTNDASGFLINVTAVAADHYQTIALKSDGTVWAWGYNGSGQLGNGTTTDSPVPVQVSGLTDVTAIVAGHLHFLAEKSDGTVWAWGHNYSGQLGDGTTINSPIPVKVSGLTNAITVGAGWNHSVAVKSNGTIWTWGDNEYGQLGDGTNFDSLIPVPVGCLNLLTGESCDANADNDTDGIANSIDNCPLEGNTNQSNTDADWFGDACDSDSDNDGILDTEENNVPNNGDANYDGVEDAVQNNVASVPSLTTNNYITLDTTGGSQSQITDVEAHSEESLADDPDYDFAPGIIEFNITGSDGFTEAIRIYYPGFESLEGYVFRKFSPYTELWASMPDCTSSPLNCATFGTEILDGVNVAFVDLTLTDGVCTDDAAQIGDDDCTTNGRIYDPGGPALPEDLDGDGLPDFNDPDDDNDGMPDDYELSHGLNPKDASDKYDDLDGDRLTNLYEYNRGTNPNNIDSDNDGVNDNLDIYPLNDKITCHIPIMNDFFEGDPYENFYTVQEAVNDPDAGDYDIVRISEAEFDEDVVYDQDAILILSGGWMCHYGDNPSTSSINSLTIRNGGVIIENIVIGSQP